MYDSRFSGKVRTEDSYNLQAFCTNSNHRDMEVFWVEDDPSQPVQTLHTGVPLIHEGTLRYKRSQGIFGVRKHDFGGNSDDS